MQRNWVTQFTLSTARPSRFDEPEARWLELQPDLNRWGGSHTWQQLQRLGVIARIDQNG